jgi:hypothetical protein
MIPVFEREKMFHTVARPATETGSYTKTIIFVVLLVSDAVNNKVHNLSNDKNVISGHYPSSGDRD